MSHEVLNRNYLSPLKFDFSVDRLPNVNFFVQSVNIPGITISALQQGTPFSDIPWHGDKVQWEDLNVSFKVDENLRNWYEIFKWMNGLGFSQNLGQFNDLKTGQDTNLDGEKRSPLPPVGKIGHIFGQATLLVRSSTQNPILAVNYKDVFPVSLSGITFDSTGDSVVEIGCDVVFKYDYYEIEHV